MEDEAVAAEAAEAPAGWISEFPWGPLPSGAEHIQPFDCRAYWNGADRFSVTFGAPGAGLSSGVWTTREGLETVIRECQRALDEMRSRA